jgi:hypothetical protein
MVERFLATELSHSPKADKKYFMMEGTKTFSLHNLSIFAVAITPAAPEGHRTVELR